MPVSSLLFDEIYVCILFFRKFSIFMNMFPTNLDLQPVSYSKFS